MTSGAMRTLACRCGRLVRAGAEAMAVTCDRCDQRGAMLAEKRLADPARSAGRTCPDCYRCLKGYGNQRFHTLLQWPLAVPALEALKDAAPTSCAAGFADDPRPWLEAYAEGLGSPLELKFWRLFQQHGFSPAKQLDIRLTPGAPAVSVADFGIETARLAIYVDGASVHVGHRLRRDRIIRQRMKESQPAWRVVELRAADLARGSTLVKELVKISATPFAAV